MRIYQIINTISYMEKYIQILIDVESQYICFTKEGKDYGK